LKQDSKGIETGFARAVGRLAHRPKLFVTDWCLKGWSARSFPILHWETIAMAFSTNGSSRADGLSSDINITPLIDVLLVMLIIFMVIVPVVPRGLSSTIPSTAPASVRDEASDRTILVQVEANGLAARYVVDGAGLAREDISPRLAALLSKMAVRQVLVKADASLDFATVANVIDAGKAAGAESIGLVTPAMDGERR
jgi:biopolymer transport protein TolR